MKKIMAVIAAVLALSLSACSTENNSPAQQQANAVSESKNSAAENSGSTSESGGNILVVYFTAAENSGVDAVSSASVLTIDGNAKGISQAIADMIAEKTGGDLFSVQTNVVYPAEIGALIDYVAEEQEAGTLPELTTHIDNLDDYDTVFIGFPIWWYDMPQVMYSFFEEYDFSGKTIVPFTVHNGSRLSGTPAKIQELEPDATVIEDGFTVSQQSAAKAEKDVADWLEGLGF